MKLWYVASEDAVVIDTQDLTADEFLEEYGVEGSDPCVIEVEHDITGYPTDRVLSQGEGLS